MNEKPILFSGEMVRALLDGRKTQTRRLIKMRDGSLCDDADIPCYAPEEGEQRANFVMDYSKTFPQWQQLDCPYGKIGDRLWVREKWQALSGEGRWWHQVKREDRPLLNWAWTNPIEPSFEQVPPRWLPGIHMLRMACRINLEIINVCVEKLQEITADDIEREGAIAKPTEINDAVSVWSALWDSINADEGKRWDDNPYVWVIEFKVL
jgi:hypothetical protein